MVNAFRWMVFVIGLAVVIGSIMVTSAGDPTIAIYSPSDGDTVYTDTITVKGGANMGTDGALVESVTVNGDLVDGTTSWSKYISLQLGQNKITAEATDISGNCDKVTIYVEYEISTPTPTPTPTPTHPNGPRPTPTPIPTPTPTTPPQTGSISITTTPSGAEVYLDDSVSSEGTTPITLKDVTVGYHSIKVIKEGYHSATRRNIYLGAGITKELAITLKPITGSIFVSSTPSGASVYLDNVDMKANTTCMLSEVVVGQHTIKLTKSDYFDLISNVSVSDSTPTYLHENLTGYGSINISSDPFGACVYLDNVYMNKTTPCMLSEIVVGPHIINLTKSGYFNVTRNVSVSVGRTHHVHENLTECGSLYISSNQPGANVFVDGNYRGKTPKNISTVALGNHTIKLTKFCYDTVIRNVTVSVGEPLHLHENLTGYGSLCISSKPSGAKVYLNGDYKGKTLLDIPKVVEGSYTIRLKKIGYGEVEERIDVPAAELKQVNVILALSPSILEPSLDIVAIIIALIALGASVTTTTFILKFNWISEKFRKLVDILHTYIEKSRNTIKTYISERGRRNG